MTFGIQHVGDGFASRALYNGVRNGNIQMSSNGNGESVAARTSRFV